MAINTAIHKGLCQSDLDMAGFYLINYANDFSSGGPPVIPGISGTTPLISGQNYIEVVFGAAQDDANWVLTGCVVVNTVDAIPLNLQPGILTVKSTTGFTLQLNGAPDTANYSLQWAVGMTSGGVSHGGGSGSTVISTAYAATINVVASTAPSGGTLIVQVGTLTGNVTLANPTSPTNRQRLEYVLKQDGTGNRSLTLGAKFRLPTSSSLVFPADSSNNPDYAAAGKKTRLMAEYRFRRRQMGLDCLCAGILAMSFTAAVPTTGEKVNLTFSGSVGSVDSTHYPVVSNGEVMELGAATGAGTAWSLPLTVRSGWVPSGQTVAVTGIDTGAFMSVTNNSTVTQRQRRYVERGFGIFVHFTSSQYGTSGAITLPYVQAIDMPSYDMEQWFTSVIVPSGARYAVFTTKHDGGLSWWPTTAGNWNISQTAFGVAHSGADMVRDWVRLCRKYNIGVGLYINMYDPWFVTNHPSLGYGDPAYIPYMTQQITELFSNYGRIDVLWLDSFYTVSYFNFPWANVVALRDALQPECILANNEHGGSSLTYNDIAIYEGSGAPGPSPPTSSNVVPSEFAEDSRSSDAWIWTALNGDSYKDVYTIAGKLRDLKAARCSYLLNFPANNSGLMPTSTGTYATQLGAIIGKQGGNPVAPGLLNVRYGIDRGDGQTGQWGGGINSSAILGVL